MTQRKRAETESCQALSSHARRAVARSGALWRWVQPIGTRHSFENRWYNDA